MTKAHGQFSWCELMTTDVAAATRFYETAVGWRATDAGLPDRRYMIVHGGETPVGGIMDLPDAARYAGARPGWMPYISADDVDAAAAGVARAGGVVHKQAEDIPGVGRFAVVSDPQGAAFTLFKPVGAAMPPAAGPQGEPGRVGWHELRAADGAAAFDVYAGLFGWMKTDVVDMGPMGLYQMFATDQMTVGGIMTTRDPSQRGWLDYVNVDEIEAAIARVKQGGGDILNGPIQVPGGSWIAHGLDPQGAAFAMVSTPPTP